METILSDNGLPIEYLNQHGDKIQFGKRSRNEMITGSAHNTKYLIPYEMCNTEIHNSKGLVVSEWEDSWVIFHKITKVLESLGYTIEQYYNIYFLNKPFDYNPLCGCCDSKVKFLGVSRGYMPYCSVTCFATTNAVNQHSNKESSLVRGLEEYSSLESTKALRSSKFSDMNIENWNNKEYREKMAEKSFSTINSVESRILSKYSTFCNCGNPSDLCIFYLGLSSDSSVIKFGVTSTSIEDRQNRNNLATVHRIKNGNRENMARLERDVKYLLKDNDEVFAPSSLNFVINFIRTYKFD